VTYQLVEDRFKKKAWVVAGVTTCIGMWATKHSHNLTHNAGLASCSCSIEKKGRDTITCLPKNAEKLTNLLPIPNKVLSYVEI
jgi:hypothetical protein